MHRLDTNGKCLRPLARALGSVVLVAVSLAAQTAPDWRKIGNFAVDLQLASPVTGPVDAVWFSPGGDRLFARTHAGRILETADFETWTDSISPPAPPDPASAPPVANRPELRASLKASPSDPQSIYALGAQLYRSGDGGRTWTNLTGYGDRSVIGENQHGLAVSPRDPRQIVAANDFGVWRSLDGGLSWTGLNQRLPNLPVRSIQSTVRSGKGMRISIDGMGTAELPPGGAVARESWVPVADAGVQSETAARARVSQAINANVTVLASSGEIEYAGAADGRLWVSIDRGATWNESPQRGGGAIERIFVDPEAPRVALAAAAGAGTHLLRTTNTGLFWDDVTGNLPDVPAHGVTADRAAGAVYVATDRGVFYGRMDLNVPGAFSAWTPIAGSLPSAKAFDVKLDPTGNQIYVAFDGYGVYAARAPHRGKTLRLVNSADLSQRASAPGSLLSVLGGRIRAASAANLNFPVLSSSDTSSEIQVPFEIAFDANSPQLAISLDAASGQVNLGVPIKNVSPAIFVDRDGAPMLVDADTGLTLDAGNAARSRARIQILATGLGKVKPNWPTGVPAPLENPPAVVANVQAFVDRVPVEVTRATLAPGYVGLYLIELQLPALVNSGPAELRLSVDGQESNRVQVMLEADN